ncbi:MAG: 16S rRNA (adenine(1518)-N(6)/adenine(1519)-N(6))-dimethyltransferase RsmA [Christensenellaceae bacterium]|jgi:16S rRNA (adenine1518-N6/adenine1519-N6)-dimethyltransferase|nr:16S rRNA (adenine(1518)-N(6)/adenine(1519)-N(6))-dimethyltransferase RsmA [Christensenellaceae bacterium]
MNMHNTIGNIKFKKTLGQNFLFDSVLLAGIVDDSELSNDDVVLEIGAGAGTLTMALAKKAKTVIAVEIDHELEPYLNRSLIGINNVQVLFANVMKLSDSEINALTAGEFKIVSNIPYYLTTPLIMRFLESSLPLKSMTLTVQLEVAKRLTAKPNTPDYGAITLALKMRGEAVIKRIINKEQFHPKPKVDSAVVHLQIKDDIPTAKNQSVLCKFIRAGFAMRRKTLLNNIVPTFNISRMDALEVITSCGLDANIRGEALSLNDYIMLSDRLTEIVKVL